MAVPAISRREIGCDPSHSNLSPEATPDMSGAVKKAAKMPVLKSFPDRDGLCRRGAESALGTYDRIVRDCAEGLLITVEIAF